MKYVVVLADGCADLPLDELDGKTPLEAAKTPYMDKFASDGALLLVKTVPDGIKPGSDVANLSVLGYDPGKCYTGRSPLEAASMGVEIRADQTAFRANLVTLSDEKAYAQKTMLDYSAGEISTAESGELIKEIEKRLGESDLRFYPGVSYRHLCVWDNAPDKFDLTPPHDISGKKIAGHLPGNERLLAIMRKSEALLTNHPINRQRRARGKNPATSLWIWGDGKRPKLPLFYDKFHVGAAVVSAVDLIKGIAVLTGMQSISVEGATGNLDTNFAGKAKAAAQALLSGGKDLVYVHIEAPDECGHHGDAPGKVKSLELIDSIVIGSLVRALEESGEDYSIMVLPDHPTPVSTRTHSSDPVPCAIYRKGDKNNGAQAFTEKDARSFGKRFDRGWELMAFFLQKK